MTLQETAKINDRIFNYSQSFFKILKLVQDGRQVL